MSDDAEIARSVGKLFEGSKPGATTFASFPVIAKILHSICCIFALPFDLLLHRGHGIRYLNVILFFFSFVFHAVFAGMFAGFVAASMAMSAAYSKTGTLLGFAVNTLGFIALYAYRRRQAWPKLLAGEKLYSKSYGVPYLVDWWVPRRKKQLQTRGLPLTRDADPQWITGYAEPIVLIVVGISIGIIVALVQRAGWTAPAAFYAALPSVWIAGVAMWLRGQIDRAMFLERFCDAIDSQLENESLAAFINGNPEVASEMGFVIPAAREWKEQSRATLREAMIAQNPAFARLFVDISTDSPGDSRTSGEAAYGAGQSP